MTLILAAKNQGDEMTCGDRPLHVGTSRLLRVNCVENVWPAPSARGFVEIGG
jgi:hypothetical protein